jgi:hypothetical protein
MARPDTNYLTGPELAQVGKLLTALNEGDKSIRPLATEVKLIDSNGEDAGEINYSEQGAYVYYPPAVSS